MQPPATPPPPNGGTGSAPSSGQFSEAIGDDNNDGEHRLIIQNNKSNNKNTNQITQIQVKIDIFERKEEAVYIDPLFTIQSNKQSNRYQITKHGLLSKRPILSYERKIVPHLRAHRKTDKAGAKSEKKQKMNDLSLTNLIENKSVKRRASLSYRGGPGGGSRRHSRTLRGGSLLKMQSSSNLFLKDRVGNNTVAGGGIAIGSNSDTSQSPSSPRDCVGRMREISEVSDLLNQEMIGQGCIKVNITQHSTGTGWSPKYNKSILKTLNDIIYFNENTKEWYMDYYVHLDNKHEVRIYKKPIDNMPSADDMVAQFMQEASASSTDDNSLSYIPKRPNGSRNGNGSVVRHCDGDSQFTTLQPSPQLDPYCTTTSTGIKIETNDVYLDLNGHSLLMSEYFYHQQRWFTTIKLPTQYFLLGQSFTNLVVIKQWHQM